MKTIQTIDPYKEYDMDKKVIGEGGYGKVYKAIEKKTGNRVVLKYMKRGAITIDEAFDTIQISNELTDNAKVCNIGLMCYKRVFLSTEMGHPMVFVMNLVEGIELVKLIDCLHQSKNQFPFMIGLSIALQCFAILDFFHSKDMAHLDLKPSNMIYNYKSGLLTFIDYDLVCNRQKFKNYECFVGTPMYSAPDLLTSGIFSMEQYKAGDVWSIGASLLELFTYKVPYPEKYRYKDMMVNKPAECDYRIDTEDGKVICKIIDKILNRSWRDRPTAKKLYDVTESFWNIKTK